MPCTTVPLGLLWTNRAFSVRELHTAARDAAPRLGLTTAYRTMERWREEGFAPLKDLMETFVKAGGAIYVCSPCFKKRAFNSIVPLPRWHYPKACAPSWVP